MPRRITVTTPENVRIEYELAGLISRGGAALIDLFLQGLLIGAVLALYTWLQNNGKLPAVNWIKAALWVVIFVIFWGYYAFFETIWNGQTPGKRWTGLRAVREGGQPVDLTSASVRNLLRIIDMIPVLIPYIVAAISVFFSKHNKRLGDYAAGTVVVKERREQIDLRKFEQQLTTTTASNTSYIKNLGLITPAEFEAAKAFVDRAPELQPDVREEIAAKIAVPIMNRLGIEASPQIPYSTLLAELYDRCKNERGMR